MGCSNSVALDTVDCGCYREVFNKSKINVWSVRQDKKSWPLRSGGRLRRWLLVEDRLYFDQLKMVAGFR